MLMKNLDTNDFSSIVDNNFHNIFIKELKEYFKSKKKSDNIKIISKKKKFIKDTFDYKQKCFKKLKELNYCLVFLNSYPRMKLWRKTFSRTEYLMYHLENYYKNIVGVLDRYLLLVNCVYNLGIPDEDVRYGLITRNKHIKDQTVNKILKSIYRKLNKDKIISLRNTIIHRGGYEDKELMEIDFRENLYRLKDLMNNQSKSHTMNKLLLKIHIKKKQKKIRKLNEYMIEESGLLFSSLLNKYKEKIKDL